MSVKESGPEGKEIMIWPVLVFTLIDSVVEVEGAITIVWEGGCWDL